jgi:polyribonucleotide nucleotidyltransferase
MWAGARRDVASSQEETMIHNVTAQIGPSPIVIETGKLAKLADGAVTVRSGETIVMVSAVSATKIKEGQDFFPLTVDYREKSGRGW